MIVVCVILLALFTCCPALQTVAAAFKATLGDVAVDVIVATTNALFEAYCDESHDDVRLRRACFALFFLGSGVRACAYVRHDSTQLF